LVIAMENNPNAVLGAPFDTEAPFVSYFRMEERVIFRNLSPIDHRYSISEHDLFEALVPWLSEEAVIHACAKAEIALIKAHLSLRGTPSAALLATLDTVGASIESEAVYAEEEKTQHNIRALVNVMKKLVPAEVAPLVHLGPPAWISWIRPSRTG